MNKWTDLDTELQDVIKAVKNLKGSHNQVAAYVYDRALECSPTEFGGAIESLIATAIRESVRMQLNQTTVYNGVCSDTWISVDDVDKLPKWGKPTRIIVANIDDENKIVEQGWWAFNGFDDIEIMQFTHWRPMPLHPSLTVTNWLSIDNDPPKDTPLWVAYTANNKVEVCHGTKFSIGWDVDTLDTVVEDFAIMAWQPVVKPTYKDKAE